MPWPWPLSLNVVWRQPGTGKEPINNMRVQQTFLVEGALDATAFFADALAGAFFAAVLTLLVAVVPVTD